MATKQINEFTAVGASALTDQLLTETAANATRKCTLTQVFALLDDQALTWTAAQAFGAAVTMATTLGVTGTATVGNLTTAGTGTIGTLTVTGTSSHAGAATFGSTLGVTGATTLSSTLAAGASTLASLAVTGAATVGTTLGVTGAATLGSTLAVTTSAYVAAAPTVYTVYSVGSRVENTATTGTRGLAVFEFIADPSGASTAAHSAVTGSAQTKAGNAQNISSSGLYGVRGDCRHLGSGTIAQATGFIAPAFTNSGGGTITNVFGFYASAQTVGGTNWGFYASGNASKFINSTLAPIQVSNTTSFRGALGSNSNVGTYFGYLAEYDGTNWYARSTGAGIVRVTNGNFTVYLDSSGLTADTTYTPSARFNVDSTWGGKCLLGPTAPTVISTGSYAFATMPTFTGTAGTIVGIGSQSIAQPSGASTANYYAFLGYTDTVAAETNSITGIYGARLAVRNYADAAVTGAYGLYVSGSLNAGAGVITTYYGLRSGSITNTGAGSITTAYGIFIDAQTAAGTNWGLYQSGSTTNNRFSGKLGIKMDPSNDLDVTGTFGVTGISTFGAQINLKSYTVATLPSAATGGGMVWVSDAAGSACGALSNGTNWKRCDSMATTVT